jgi:tRNA1Val (adenine37-N6)-methyltransferase
MPDANACHKSQTQMPDTNAKDKGYIGVDWVQPEDGYKFSSDSVLLAEFAPIKVSGYALDLCAGSGVVGLEALAKGRLVGLKGLYFVELMDYFSPYLNENIERAKALLEDPPELKGIIADYRELNTGDFKEKLSYISSNPPYIPLLRGRVPKSQKMALAKTEIKGDLKSLLEAGSRLLKAGGIFDLSLPRKRISEVSALIKGGDFNMILIEFPKRKRCDLLLIRLQKPCLTS